VFPGRKWKVLIFLARQPTEREGATIVGGGYSIYSHLRRGGEKNRVERPGDRIVLRGSALCGAGKIELLKQLERKRET